MSPQRKGKARQWWVGQMLCMSDADIWNEKKIRSLSTPVSSSALSLQKWIVRLSVLFFFWKKGETSS